MTDIPDEELEPQRVADLRPFIRRLRRAENERERLTQLLAVADVEYGAARQEFDDAVEKVLDARGNA